METTLSGPQQSSPFPALSDTPALLLDLEEFLIGQLQSLGGDSHRQRLAIETELSEIRHDLERLGFARSQ
jgi:hypothetical protein